MTETTKKSDFGSIVPEPWYSDEYRQHVQEFYEAKTATLIRRYEHLPRIHYHTGIIDNMPPHDTPVQERHTLSFGYQERCLRRLLDLWREYQAEPKEILDVGCGLGGGSLFWAENFQANVAAITVESTHVPIVAKFAERAGLGAQVSCRVADVLSLEEQGAYDAAVALGSTCHIARAAFYRRMAKVLRPGGCVVIADFYKGLGSKADERAGIVDEHWQCRLPHVREHLDGAAAAGFRLLSLHDLSKITQPFWEFSADLWRLEGKERVFKEGERARWERSVHCHEALYAGLGEGDLEYGFLVFRLGHDA